VIELVLHAEGVILPVKAQPRASRDGIRGEAGGMLKVSVTQVAEKGKANQAILEVLAEGLGMRRSQIELISGETQSQKKFLIRGVTREELARRIAALVG
jgi:uncharacterized protein